MAGTRAAVFELSVRLRSPALLGGRLGAGGVAQTWLVHGDGASAPRRAMLPGSSLRGVLRHASRRFAAARGVICTRERDGEGTCACLTCELFGGSGQRGRLRVRSGIAATPTLVDVTRVAIDRQRGTAAEEALWSSRLALGDFDVRLELDALPEGLETAEDPAAEHLRALLGWLETVGIAVGRSKSTTGRADLAVREVEPPPAPAVAAGDGRSRRWRLRLQALEPFRLAALRDRPFFQHGKPFVPAPTLVGAIGWGLVRAGRPDLAEELFERGRMWVSEAWPPGARGDRWRASARACERCGRAFDVAVAQTAAALADRDVGEQCPHCGDLRARLRRLERTGAPLLVSGHTAIDPESGRVHEGRLYQQQVCEPGTTFVADLLAPEWAAEAVASLGELAVGGARSRGLGRASVAVEDAPEVASFEDCLSWVRERLGALGATPGDDVEVAIFDVVTSAHVPEGVEAVVRDKGGQLVTGEADVELLGGWEERRDETRPLREVLARGSWLAVRGPAEALVDLEGIVVADARDWCPLWLRLREPESDGGDGIDEEVGP